MVMTQPRRPAGTPVGGQFAPGNRLEATGIELSDDDLIEAAMAAEHGTVTPAQGPAPSHVAAKSTEDRLAALDRCTHYGPEYDRSVVSALSDHHHFDRLGEHDNAEHYLLLAETRAGLHTWEEYEELDPFRRVAKERQAAEIHRAAEVLQLTVEEIPVGAIAPGDLVWFLGSFYEVTDDPQDVVVAGHAAKRFPVQRHGHSDPADLIRHLDFSTDDAVMGWHYRGDEDDSPQGEAAELPVRPPAGEVIARIFPDGEPQRGRRRHKLLPQEVVERIPELYETEGTPVEDKVIHAHYFVGKADWHIAELDRETGEMFGRCDLGLGYPEWGYVRIQDLAELQGQFRLPVERELDFEPKTARELGLVKP